MNNRKRLQCYFFDDGRVLSVILCIYRVCYVYNQWYDISCDTLYVLYIDQLFKNKFCWQ